MAFTSLLLLTAAVSAVATCLRHTALAWSITNLFWELNCSLWFCISALNLLVVLLSPALNWLIAVFCAALNCFVCWSKPEKNWVTWLSLEALNCAAAFKLAWSVNKDCITCCVLNNSVCCALVTSVKSFCKKDCAFCTAACWLLDKFCESKPAKALASLKSSACLLLKFCKLIVLEILLFSNCTCCSAVKFELATSDIRAAFCTLLWKFWSKSWPIKAARCCADNIALCWLLERFCTSNWARILASACAIGMAASSVAWITAWPAIEDDPKPRRASISLAARIAPAAHGGGLVVLKFSVSCSICPCTVACVVGDALAAWICSV